MNTFLYHFSILHILSRVPVSFVLFKNVKSKVFLVVEIVVL